YPRTSLLWMLGGIMAYTACAPRNASESRFASVTSATNGSAPALVSGCSRSAVLPIARTFWPRERRVLAATLPVWPVAPVMTYIVNLLDLNFDGYRFRCWRVLLCVRKTNF